MFIDLARTRHSCRQFTDEPLTDEQKRLIIEAGGLAPSAKNRRPVKLISIEKDAARSLAGCKDSGTKALETSTFAVAVAAEPSVDTWAEDCSIAAIMMQLEAEELGLGSCWIHCRNRSAGGVPSNDIVCKALGLSGVEVLCVIAFGVKA